MHPVGGTRLEPSCGARTVFWPNVEACEAICSLPPHTGGVHEDTILGEWSESDLTTFHPWEGETHAPADGLQHISGR